MFIARSGLGQQATARGSLPGRAGWSAILFRRKILREVIDDVGEFCFGAFRAAADHIGNDAAPLLTRHSFSEDDFGGMAGSANFLDGFAAWGIGQLGRARSGLSIKRA